MNASSVFTAADKAYIANVMQALQVRTASDGADLSALTSNGNYSLQDQQRQTRINAILRAYMQAQEAR